MDWQSLLVAEERQGKMLTESQQVYEPGDIHRLDFWPADMRDGKCY